MFYRILIVASVLCGRRCFSESGENKLTDSDIQSCIENFDIHKDKIIRTQDSRAMGAKYLNEIDLDSREECLRLCCETEDCDVFVFEEKNAGSCYLFQCGPPEDFKCKFTHHVNYTSAVLAVNRHLPDLESQIRLTKHEQDLSKLRKPEVKSIQNVQIPQKIETTPFTTTTTRITPIKTSPPTNRKCSIYQFECRSTGECIAIYNACDGIPQCADGSDEAPELRCPEATTSTPIQSHISNSEIRTVPLEKQQSNILQLQQSQIGEVYHPVVAQAVAPQNPPSDFLRPISDPLRMHPYEAPQMPQYPQYQPQANWPPHQLPPPRYADKNSHIFNHKENGFQVGDVGESSQIQYEDAGRDPKYSSYYGSEVYRQPAPQIKETWTNNQPDYNKVVNNNPYLQNANPVGTDKWDQTAPVEVKDMVNPKFEQEKIAHELKHSREHFKNASVDTAEKKSVQKGRPTPAEDDREPQSEPENYAVVAEYKIAAEMIEDGVADTPGGAVLSLTLGIIITSLMGVLIACRLRVVRRRLRRGGKSYAHDADYLVNGMYL